ncbi:flagellar hook-associated protein FlgK [Pseudomaricurvus sp.]|uniref:flagellar hook-associated protein FlgK n=1 Tax=Pseudomaricurvus sp. TaxID=2004510 RepID=UPI003F6D4605
MAGLLSSAISGLKVSQNALQTAGHNIANANTPGYSRQQVSVASNPGQFTGSGFIGNGASVSTIERAVDQFLTSQLRGETSLSSGLNAFNDQIGQLDNLLSDSTTGLSNSLNQFYASMENAADDPGSIASRQQLISQAENLSGRFNSLYDNLETLNKGVQQNMSAAVQQVNVLAKSIAELNQSITKATGESGHTPNDLLDKRDELLRQLSELVNVDVVDQGDGMMNVNIGSGQALVVGSSARELAVVNGNPDPQQKGIVYVDGSSSQDISRYINGGQLGGLMEFNNETLSNAYNELGRVAIGLSDSINQAHRLGVDLNGQLGGDFFRDVNNTALMNGRVLADSGNTLPSNLVMGAEITNVGDLTNSDYVLEVSPDGSTYHVTRESDGEVVTSGDVSQPIEFDGVSLDITGTFNSGDRFLIQPTKAGARDIATVISKPEQVALASPLETSTDGGNLGNATISAGSVNQLTDAGGVPLLFPNDGTMSPPLLVQFTSATTYDILDNSDPGNPQPLATPITGQTFIPGQTNDLPVDALGISVSISGVPQTGDRFTMDFNTDASTDNRNALSLIDVTHAGILDGGATDLSGAYGHLVQTVGIQTNASNINLEASQQILTQTQSLRDSISGVNLDEEAASLIQYEQMYNANAQVISVARDLFDRLVGIF